MINKRRSSPSKAKIRFVQKRCVRRFDRIFTMCSAISLVLCIIFLCVAGSYGGPLHASCKLTWTFNSGCADVKGRLVKQIKLWNGPDGCDNGGEKCLYKLVSQTDNQIKATHATPKKEYIDDLTFDFSEKTKNVCNVAGFSTSETWYALLDYGTNYCNLHNLLTGAGLDKVSGYKEETSNSICTQYSSADCKKY